MLILCRHTSDAGDFFAQFFNIFAFLTNHYAWTGSVNSHADALSWTLDHDARHGRSLQSLVRVLTDLKIAVQVVCELFSALQTK